MVSLGAGAWAIAIAAIDTKTEYERSRDARMATTLDHVRPGFN
jgi:hypothetical protein